MRGFIERSVIARSGVKSSVSWSCRTLDEVDHAIFLIAHGVQHAWCSLHWLLDLAAIVEREEPGFHERLAHSIAALKMGRKLELSLRVYRRVFGRPVPEALAQAGTRGGAAPGARCRIRHLLCAESRGRPGIASGPARHDVRLQAEPCGKLRRMGGDCCEADSPNRPGQGYRAPSRGMGFHPRIPEALRSHVQEGKALPGAQALCAASFQ